MGRSHRLGHEPREEGKGVSENEDKETRTPYQRLIRKYAPVGAPFDVEGMCAILKETGEVDPVVERVKNALYGMTNPGRSNTFGFRRVGAGIYINDGVDGTGRKAKGAKKSHHKSKPALKQIGKDMQDNALYQDGEGNLYVMKPMGKP
jgi:hypothetical protein